MRLSMDINRFTAALNFPSSLPFLSCVSRALEIFRIFFFLKIAQVSPSAYQMPEKTTLEAKARKHREPTEITNLNLLGQKFAFEG